MGTAVLRAKNCLETRFQKATFRSSQAKSSREFAGNTTKSGRRKRCPPGFTRKRGGDCREQTLTKINPARKLVMGQVTILKRGEELKSVKDRRFEEDKDVESDEDLPFRSIDRLVPEPDLVPKHIRMTDLKSDEFPRNGMWGYAGSAFSSSPSPSSLPLPAFFKKKDVANKTDLATKDLLRLLRLDLQ